MNVRYRTIVADPPWPITGFPGWGYKPGGYDCPYPTMTISAIQSLPVFNLAEPAAHVYLWTTSGFLREAYTVADAWGMKVTQVLTWCKAPMGLGPGGAFANTTEFVLFGRMRIGSSIAIARHAAGLTGNDVDVALGNVRSKSPTRGTELCRRWEEDDSIPTPEQWDSLRRLLPLLSDFSDLTSKPERHNSSWFEWKRGAHSAKPEGFIDLVEQISPPAYAELFARRHRLGWDVWGNESANTATLTEAVS